LKLVSILPHEANYGYVCAFSHTLMPHGEYPEADKGKCRSCGFLSKHAINPFNLPSPRFYEAEHSERITVAVLYSHAIGYHQHVDTEPMCFLGKINLVQLIADDDSPRREGKLRAEITQGRDCDGWYPYMPGLSPREHYEELTMQRLENDRRAFETRLAEMSQKAQENSLAIADDSRAIVSDLKAIAEKNDRFSRRVTVWVIILAALQAAGTILALPSVSWVQRLWRYLLALFG
jgi:hypothetical protein